jgi:hypothetical protein
MLEGGAELSKERELLAVLELRLTHLGVLTVSFISMDNMCRSR